MSDYVETPPKLKSREFEALCILDSTWSKNHGEYCMGRYGVQAAIMGNESGGFTSRPIRSLPDFEGVLPSGRQFIFDAKVISSASFPLHTAYLKKRQIDHLISRSAFGVISFLLIHFNRRELKTKMDPQFTCAFPVSCELTFWDDFMEGEQLTLSRELAKEQGIEVPWWIPKHSKKPRPYLSLAIDRLNRAYF